jgi:hypothetical protein
MRQAFDGGPLSNNRSNRNDSKHVTDRYWLPALIGITPTELREKLEQGAFKSGSANRWLYLAVHKRDKETLHGRPNLEPDLVDRLQGMRRRAVAHPPELQADPAVYTTLREYQAHLHESAHGIETDLTRRYSVIAFRIALVHALADSATAISTEHLERALALTEYGRASLPWIFGQSTGNDDADLLLRYLIARGRLGNNQITRHLIRDPKRKQRAIDVLTGYGLATIGQSRTTGRIRAELISTVTRDGFTPFRPLFLQSRANTQNDWTEVRSTSVDGSWTKRGQNVDGSWTEVAPKTASDTVSCRDYSAHQSSHRYTEGGFVCDICAPVGA